MNKHTRTPVNAVWFNTSLGICMTFLIFGGELAAGALFSIAAVAAFVAFTIPIFIRVFFVGNRFRPGPWNLGRFSMYIGSAACAFVLIMVPILMLPSVTGSDLRLVIFDTNDPRHDLILGSADTMNWTCLVYGGPMLFVVIYWFVDAHKWFKGPKVFLATTEMLLGASTNVPSQVNIEHQMLGRPGNVVEGQGDDSGDSSAGSITKEDRQFSDKKAADLA